MDKETILYDSSPSMVRNNPFSFIVCVIVPVIGWIALFFWWLQIYNIKLTVSNERVTFRRGILSKNIREIFLSDIRSVEIDQTVIQRIMGTGKIEISSAASSDAEIIIEGVPDAYSVKKIIDEHRRKK